MIDQIDLSSYDDFNNLSSRYYELYSKDDERLIFSAKVNISFGIQDINNLINRINSKSELSDSSWYYELVIKAYQVLNAFDAIAKIFEVVKSGYDELYGPPNENDGIIRKEERQKIDYFRALRSLTTAHTLKTSDSIFKKFGITGDTYLEDVRIKHSRAFPSPDVEGDIILDIRTKDESNDIGLGKTEYRGVQIDEDIIAPIRIILSKLEMVNIKVEKLIAEREEILKSENIGEVKVVNGNFIVDLKKAVKERYPAEIETVKYTDNQESELWEIQEIYDFVTWKHTFDNDQVLHLERLQDIKRKELLRYAEKIQKMELGYEKNYCLSSGINREGIDGYSDGKIRAYLRLSKNIPNLSEIEKWEGDLSGASQINGVSDEVWGCLLLKKLQPELNKYFIIEWDTTLQELYWQYLVALFVRQESKI